MTNLAPGQTRALAAMVEQTVQTTPVYDIHTHLYDPACGDLLLWGIDDLLIYHYLIAEGFRYFQLPYETFWQLSKKEQADVIWKELFISHSPISEACRGVLTTLHQLGLDVRKQDLPSLRKWFAGWKVEDYVSRCMELGNVERICMTNSPFDDLERPLWEKGFSRDERFTAALRIDPLLLNWQGTAPFLRQHGYEVQPELTQTVFAEIRRFLNDWSGRIRTNYLMVSVPPHFQFPDETACGKILEHAVLPHCRDSGLPLALMPGVKRGVNPALKLAGDGIGLSNLVALENLCAQFPENKFMATVLARENQHTLCVIARKFRNLHIFGCWWFMNIPSLIAEITRLRLELLGLSFTPQHSDARVLDQLVYKWNHSRAVIAPVLAEKYLDLARTGWEPSQTEIERDVKELFGGAFERFCRSS